MTAPPTRFEEVAAAWVYLQHSANTRQAYRADLAGFSAWCAVHGTDPMGAAARDIEHYRASCEHAGASPATVARRLSALSSFFAHAVDAGAVDTSPMPVGRRPSAPPASQTADLDGGAAERLVAASAGLGARSEALVGLLLLDGLRLAEILAADAADVRVSAGSRRVLLVVDRRDDEAEVLLDRRTARAVVAYLDGRTTGPLLLGESPTRAPARLTRFGADYLLKKVSEAAGVDPPVSANVLRRSYVARAHAAGASVEAIGERLGNTDRRTTRRHLRTAEPRA